MDIVVATNNKGKLKEFRALLGDYFTNIHSLADLGLNCDVEETGSTFEENALLKAQYVKSQTDFAVLADDSGLQVNALGGAPGVFSARYSGENATDESNRKKLFAQLDGKNDRSAQFVCVLALILPNGKLIYAKGETKGEITLKEEGTNGFGYDAMFYSSELQKSFGIATEEEKNSVSHRSKAVKNLIEKLTKYL